jgi:hypothetical protein
MFQGIATRADWTLRPAQGNREIQTRLRIGKILDGFLKSARQFGLVGHRIPLVDGAILAKTFY